MADRYWLCGDDCTTDCGACKGAGRPAAVPDPRFRDQLAEALMGRWLSYGEDHEVDDLVEHPDRDGARITATHAGLLADALLSLVEARVQTAANQRAAEELREAADAYQRGLSKDAPTVPMSLVEVAPWLRDRAAALDPS